jgi:hypothetical protein
MLSTRPRRGRSVSPRRSSCCLMAKDLDLAGWKWLGMASLASPVGYDAYCRSDTSAISYRVQNAITPQVDPGRLN